MKSKIHVDKELFKQRMQTCYQCKSYNPLLKQCKECKCFLFLKAFLKTQKCPLNKWKEN